MPSNHTQNYNLSQWERSDKVLMEDFNADNAKIDAALKAEADARAAADGALSAALSGKGNCQLWTTTYVGTGKYGSDNPNCLSFPGRPAIVFIIGRNGHVLIAPPVDGSTAFHIGGHESGSSRFTWSGADLSWYSNDSLYQANLNQVVYMVFAFYLKS